MCVYERICMWVCVPGTTVSLCYCLKRKHVNALQLHTHTHTHVNLYTYTTTSVHVCVWVCIFLLMSIIVRSNRLHRNAPSYSNAKSNRQTSRYATYLNNNNNRSKNNNNSNNNLNIFFVCWRPPSLALSVLLRSRRVSHLAVHPFDADAQ